MRCINIIFAFLVLLLLSCKPKRNIEISPLLMEKIKLVIDNYDAYSDSNKSIMTNPPVYIVSFRKVQNDCFILIGTSLVYEPNMDFCLLYKDNLISFYNINGGCNQFIRIGSSATCNESVDFIEAHQDMGLYRSINWTYKVVEDSLVIYDQKAFPIE